MLTQSAANIRYKDKIATCSPVICFSRAAVGQLTSIHGLRGQILEAPAVKLSSFLLSFLILAQGSFSSPPMPNLLLNFHLPSFELELVTCTDTNGIQMYHWPPFVGNLSSSLKIICSRQTILKSIWRFPMFYQKCSKNVPDSQRHSWC